MPQAIRLFTVAILLSFSLTGAKAQPTEEAVALSVEVLELSKMDSLLDQLIPQMLQVQRPLLKQAMPQLSDAALDIFMEEMEAGFAAGRGEFLAMAAQSYAKYVSVDDLKNIIAFLRTETGQRMVNAQNLLQADLQPVAQQWGQAIGIQAGQRAMKRAQDEGLM